MGCTPFIQPDRAPVEETMLTAANAMPMTKYTDECIGVEPLEELKKGMSNRFTLWRLGTCRGGDRMRRLGP